MRPWMAHKLSKAPKCVIRLWGLGATGMTVMYAGALGLVNGQTWYAYVSCILNP